MCQSLHTGYCDWFLNHFSHWFSSEKDGLEYKSGMEIVTDIAENETVSFSAKHLCVNRSAVDFVTDLVKNGTVPFFTTGSFLSAPLTKWSCCRSQQSTTASLPVFHQPAKPTSNLLLANHRKFTPLFISKIERQPNSSSNHGAKMRRLRCNSLSISNWWKSGAQGKLAHRRDAWKSMSMK